MNCKFPKWMEMIDPCCTRQTFSKYPPSMTYTHPWRFGCPVGVNALIKTDHLCTPKFSKRGNADGHNFNTTTFRFSLTPSSDFLAIVILWKNVVGLIWGSFIMYLDFIFYLASVKKLSFMYNFIFWKSWAERTGAESHNTVLLLILWMVWSGKRIHSRNRTRSKY